MTKEIEEKFVSDDGYSTAADAVDGAGGKIKAKKADLNKTVDPTADDVAAAPGNVSSKSAYKAAKGARDSVVVKSTPLPEDAEASEEADEIVENVLEIDEAVAALFEGEELSEDFKKKASLIFSAAINEEVTRLVSEETARLAEDTQKQIDEAVSANLSDIVESLDGYLDYVVGEWMEENKLAIEAGIKVEMAESLMDALKETFRSHNIAVDETTVDVVAGLEDDIASLEEKANAHITENISLKAELQTLKAAKVFTDVAEGLTVTQVERLRVLSEKINRDDLDTYATDLETLKESFLSDRKSRTLVESVADEDEGDEVITEEAVAEAAPRRHLDEGVARYVNVFDRVAANRKK